MSNEDEQAEKLLQEIEREESKKEETHTKETSSAVLSDGTIIEMLYDKKENSTSLAISKNGDVRILNTFSFKGVTYEPHSPNKDLLNSNVVLFPSEPKEYGSQKELIEEIQKFTHKYLAVSPFFEKIISYYALFSWIYDDFNELPYLRGLGDYGTGKSRLLQVVGSICYTPIFASGATTVSPIFRILNDFKGTLVLDEADFQNSETTADIIKILNSGFMKGMPVIRSEGNNKKSFDVKAFRVFGPKLIATRRLYNDTALESRMITEDMNLNFPRKDVPYNIPDSFWEEALELRNKLLMFRLLKKGTIKLKPELENRDIEPRLNQIALPLMSIVDDAVLVSDIQNHIKEYNEKIKTDRTLNYNYQILDAICGLIDYGYSTPTVKQITDSFNMDLEWKEKKTPKKMGYLINKTLDLKTERTRDGYRLSASNIEKINILSKRYSIKRVSVVDNVNDVSIPEKGASNEGVLF
jgi:hypothetical protein